jgi:hypothetical protein
MHCINIYLIIYIYIYIIILYLNQAFKVKFKYITKTNNFITFLLKKINISQNGNLTKKKKNTKKLN